MPALLIAGFGGVVLLLFGGRLSWADSPAKSPQDTAAARDASVSPGKYWLGIQCEPASEAVRDQLELAKDEGLVVVRVMPGGPADKAEIRVNDLLLSVNHKKLGAVADLAAAVEAAKGEPLALKLLRGGKPIEVGARPGLRPRDPAADAPPDSDREMVERWLKQFGVNAPSSRGNGITFVHPGAGLVLPPGVNLRPELPDDMSVDIRREGKKPAEITVTKGKQTWKATEDDLTKLPEEIRHQVEPLLHDGPVRLWFRDLNSSDSRPNGNAGSAKARDLNELSRRLDEMRQSLEDLRNSQQNGR